MHKWKHLMEEQVHGKKHGSSGHSGASSAVDLSKIPDDQIWDDLPKHLRNKKKMIYIRNHSDLKLCSRSAKFMLLLWKDWLTMKRRWFSTLLEALTPVIAVAVLTIIVSVMRTESHSSEYKPFEIKTKVHTFEHCKTFTTSPKGELVSAVVKELRSTFGSNFTFKELDNKEEYRKEIQSDLCAVIEFEFGVESSYPKLINYTIRMPAVHRGTGKDGDEADGFLSRGAQWDTAHSDPKELVTGPRNDKDVHGGSPGYYEEGFLYLQNLIAEIIIRRIFIQGHASYSGELEANQTYDALMENLQLKMNRFPYPSNRDNRYVIVIHDILPLTIVISYLIPFMLMVYGSVIQKESGIRIQMKAVGIPINYHRIVWVIRSLCLHMPAVAIITAILSTNWTHNGTGILANTESQVFFLLMVAYLFKTVCISMLLVVFFKRASTATASCGFLWIVSYIPYYYVKSNYNSFANWERAIACILGNTAISLGCHIISDGEARGNGVSWDTLFDGEFSVGFVILILFGSGSVEIFLSRYISRVLPDKGIRPLPWHYCIHPWFWKGSLPPDESSKAIQHLLGGQSLEEKFPENFEQESHFRRRKELQLEKVTKYFGTDRVLNKINLNCYEGHITILIGEEGSGKSTLLSIVAGLIPPTIGSIDVSRQDMTKQMKTAVAFVGYCTSENILYPYLTVEETLTFFCKLKCIRSGLEQWDEVNRFITEAMLSDYRHSRVADLTFSSKRIVMVACAFVGGSRVVLLDDPTRNMNAAQKRVTWDFISRQKKHRTIVVAMTSMNESDTVADRIICLQHGEANTAGSVRFFQLRYGGGYHLLVKRDERCNVRAIRDLVKRRVQDSHLSNEGEIELDFYLPEDQSSSFPGLFEEMEKQKKALGIRKIKNSYITMDEVLMNVKRIAMETDYDPDHRKAIYQGVEEVPINLNYKKLTGYKYFKAQFGLLLLKNIRYTVRRRRIFVTTSFAPIILVFICSLTFFLNKPEDGPPPITFGFTVLAIYAFGNMRFISFLDFLQDYQYQKKGNNTLLNRESLIDCFDAIYEGTFICNHLRKSMSHKYANANITELYRQEIAKYVLEKYQTRSSDDEIPLLGIKVGTNTHPEKCTEIVGFFNNQPLHVPPLALLMMDNAIMDYAMGALTSLYPQYVEDFGYNSHVLSVTNHPLPYTAADRVKFSGIFISSGFFLGVFGSLGFSLLVASFVVLEVQEKAFKHLQMLAGANVILFWLANYLWNFVHFTCVAIPVSLITFVFNLENGFSPAQLLSLFTLLEVYGLTSVFFVGSWSLIPVDNWGMAFSRTFLFLILTGPLFCLMIIVLSDPTAHVTLEVLASFHNIFLYFPSYSLAMGIFYVIANAVHGKECNAVIADYATGCNETQNIFIHPLNEFERAPGKEALWSCCLNHRPSDFDYIAYGIGRNIQCMLTVAVISLGVRIFEESPLWTKRKLAISRWKIKHWKTHDSFEHEIYDYDVLAETYGVQHGLYQKEEDLVIKNLTKHVPTGKKVDNLCVHVSPGQCFCLLGAAGAGKTDALRMIVGSRIPSSGDISYQGVSLMTKYTKYIRKLGYCPDISPFLDELTGHEVLELVGVLRGIPYKELDGFITNLSLRLLFLHDLDNPILTYNSISIRKLSAAVSLLGEPEVIIFDEPTHSIDLISREYLFKIINQLVEKGKIVIISSKSVAEVESVCSSMAIMVNGTLRCFGTPQHLRSLFSEGFTIVVKFILDPKKIYFTTKRDKFLVHERRDPADRMKKKASKHYLNEDSDRLSVGDITLFPERSAQATIVEVGDEAEHENMLTTWEEDLLPFVSYFERNFPESILVDKQPGFLHYHIRERYTNASTLYTKMEEAKVLVTHIETYYIGESNLDQVFINFARGQKPTD